MTLTTMTIAEATAEITFKRQQPARRLLAKSVSIFALLLSVLITTAVAQAQTDDTMYAVDLAAGRVLTVNQTTGAATFVSNLSFASAAAGRRNSDGILFYQEFINGGATGRMATWNPATNTNVILGAAVTQVIRMAFDQAGTLYAMDSANRLHIINTTNGQITQTLGTVTGGGLAAPTNGGDIAFSPNGTLYLLAAGVLYTINTGTLTASAIGNTGIASPTGVAFGAGGFFYASELAGNSRIFRIDPANAQTTTLGLSGVSVGDLATMPKYGNVSITKVANNQFVIGQNANYTLTVSNAGPQNASGTVTVTDTLPNGLTYVSATGTNWTCANASGTVTCTNPNAVASGTSLPAITLTVAVAAAAMPSVQNTARVATTTFDHVTPNNTSTVTTPVTNAPPAVSLIKSVSPAGNTTSGTDLTYTIAFTNTGGQSAIGFRVIDPDPASSLRLNLNSDFKIGSAALIPGTSGLTAVFEYSNDNAATWTYTPASAAGGAPAGYDRNVTHVRWVFTGSLSQTAPNNTGSVSFIVRVK